jgi:hypothetical protein
MKQPLSFINIFPIIPHLFGTECPSFLQILESLSNMCLSKNGEAIKSNNNENNDQPLQIPWIDENP